MLCLHYKGGKRLKELEDFQFNEIAILEQPLSCGDRPKTEKVNVILQRQQFQYCNAVSCENNLKTILLKYIQMCQ